MYRHIEKLSSRSLICLIVKMRYEVAVYATMWHLLKPYKFC